MKVRNGIIIDGQLYEVVQDITMGKGVEVDLYCCNECDLRAQCGKGVRGDRRPMYCEGFEAVSYVKERGEVLSVIIRTNG